MTNDHETVTIETKYENRTLNMSHIKHKNQISHNHIRVKSNNSADYKTEKENKINSSQQLQIPIQINAKFKLILVCLSLTIYLCHRIFLIDEEIFENLEKSLNTSTKCFYDELLLIYTAGINKFLSQNLIYKDFLILLSTTFMDTLTISFMFYFIKFSKCEKPFMTLFLFYFIRSKVQNIFLLSFYENNLYYIHGGFSFTVPLGRTADFFYSGHCGCSTVLTLFFKENGVKLYYYFGIVVTLIQIFTLTLVRAHYSIDILFGIIIGHYLYILVGIFLEDVFPKIRPVAEKVVAYFKDFQCW